MARSRTWACTSGQLSGTVHEPVGTTICNVCTSVFWLQVMVVPSLPVLSVVRLMVNISGSHPHARDSAGRVSEWAVAVLIWLISCCDSCWICHAYICCTWFTYAQLECGVFWPKWPPPWRPRWRQCAQVSDIFCISPLMIQLSFVLLTLKLPCYYCLCSV